MQGVSIRDGRDGKTTLTNIGVYDRFVSIRLGEDLTTTCKTTLALAPLRDKEGLTPG